jgi:UDP-N-acetylmuramyl pentapeptide phosphotransferase/UDP-N-acetylglucosamine-1-phosphate transferase
MSTYSISMVLGLSMTACLLWGLRPFAIRWGLVDRPSHRKLHVGEIPLVGGVGMYVGLLGAILLNGPDFAALYGLLAAAGLLVLVGVLDDLRELTARQRFLAQVAASLIMTYWGKVLLVDFGALLAPDELVYLGAWAAPITVFSMVGVINAVNFSDGLDGLVAAWYWLP